jgi:16S rRNA (adenine1518-N6/adenine1519-N6)-dimethyltransferase
VSPNVFFPKPRVLSSVVHLRVLAQPRYPLVDEAHFRAMVRAVFGKRRKTLRNSLKYFLGDAGPAIPAGVDVRKRPEQFSVEQLVDLANALRGGSPSSPPQRSR